VDYIPERLKLARSIGAIPIDFTMSDPVAQIEALRAEFSVVDTVLPGEEKMKGVMSGIDAVGYQAKSRSDPSKESPVQVINDLVRLINPTGHLALAGVYTADDPGGADAHARNGKYMLPLGELWEKGMTVGTGQTPVKKFILMLRDMIIGGVAKPGFIVSHRISFDEVPDAYDKFARRTDGYTKVIIDPAK
jgi:glutathione-independent formaldehyde dehydrogenase